MNDVFFVRVVGVMLAAFTASFISFPTFPSTGVLTLAPAPSVNRTLKGDRLPSVSPAVWSHELGSPAGPVSPAHPASGGKVPVGCETAFSPISAPHLANVFRRCVV
ncbi:MAG: hypothetical protein P4L80_04685 [Xanthobacteraceae bacterium]|nr:hypothetical protein [Xanthobacteraceae bacterium]HLN47908.1 hypothetical protein [Steroidobacteraceae bacterium]